MSGTRALFASIGASLLLVAAAALSLLALSALFAFGGWSDPVAQADRQTALILAGSDSTSAGQPKALVLSPRAPSRATRSTAPSPRGPRAAGQDDVAPPATPRPPAASSAPPALGAPATPTVTAPAPAAGKPSAGDGVSSLGDELGGTVQDTGDALEQITDPVLPPPVTAATQKLLDAVAELLSRSTDGLGSTIDAEPAPR